MKTFTAWHTWPDGDPGLDRRLPAGVVAELGRAVRFATAYHGDQRRKLADLAEPGPAGR